MGKVRFGLSKDSSSVRQVRTPEAIIQYIDRVIEVPVPVEVVRTEVQEKIIEVPGPERIIYVDNVSRIEPIINTVYVDKIVEVPGPERVIEMPVITRGDDMELKELKSQFDRHQDFSNQKQNEQSNEIKNLKNKLDKQQKLFFIYGAISGILTVLGILLTK